MADAISLYLDISQPVGRLWKSLNERTEVQIPAFFQGQLLNFRIYPIVPIDDPDNFTPPFFSKVPLTGLDIQMAVGPRAGTEAIKASQYTWAAQTANDSDGLSGYFYASLNLNTTDLNTLVGTNDSINTYFEVELSRSGGAFTPVFQQSVQIFAVVKDPGGAASVPTPAVSYLTADQCLNLFVMWNNTLRAANAGRGIILTSPDSSHTRELAIDNDGVPNDNLT